ncbi:manganese-dependent inorganic pyrophosphatase [Ruminococcaceae bacterium YRB3002]|nr:manganese-dependent inorganic pyrophosphatase [Ruminococcaceae bacterium YRB3002]
MSTVYVVGHRNPDTDSVVSAMAYAALRNASGDRNYVAGRLDHLSDETKRMLAKFGFSSPVRIKDVRTQVSDIDFDRPPVLEPSATLDYAWKTMNDNGTTSIPVVNPDGTLFGTLSAGDIASYTLNTIDDPHVTELPLFNLLGVLEGQIAKDGKCVDMISGDIVIAIPSNGGAISFTGSDRIVLCGDQPDMIRNALESNVNALILCGVTLDKELISQYKDSDTCVIYTPFDVLRTSKLISQSMPIERVCAREDLVCFHLTDYIDDVRDTILKSRYRSYPVLDEEDKVVGTLSRFHLLRPRRKNIVLVDHNESAQSVPGLEQAEILEIIDHHRLADIQTSQPINVRNETVGSTTTIIAEMYQECGIAPSPAMAGLMVSAILSDTVMFKSPTCTERDKVLANRLARIAGITIEEIGAELYDASGVNNLSAERLIRTDFKEFHIAGQTLGVSQIICVDSKSMTGRKDEFLETMEMLKKKNGYDMVILMLTDVLLEGTVLLYIGSDDVIQNAFSAEAHDNELFLPGVMSRKKQIIPMLTALWG